MWLCMGQGIKPVVVRADGPRAAVTAAGIDDRDIRGIDVYRLEKPIRVTREVRWLEESPDAEPSPEVKP